MVLRDVYGGTSLLYDYVNCCIYCYLFLHEPSITNMWKSLVSFAQFNGWFMGFFLNHDINNRIYSKGLSCVSWNHGLLPWNQDYLLPRSLH